MEPDRRLGVTSGQGRNPAIEHSPGRSTAPDDGEDRSVSQGDAFEVLCNRRRRQVISLLRERDGDATAGELAEAIAATEAGTAVEQVSSAERKRVYVSLYQNHLPVMDDAAVVDYDADRKTVRLLATPSELRPYATTVDRPRRRLSIGVALAVAALVLAGGLQVGAFAATPAALWPLVGGIGLLGAVALGVPRAE